MCACKQSQVVEPHHPAPIPRAAFESSTTIASTGRTFVFNNLPMDQATGETFCNEQGGHLAVYNSSYEQREVELYFISKGLLLPNYHKHYWLGYNSDSQAWPIFKPVDASVLPLTSPGAYNHFGILRFTNTSLSPVAEPNNYFGGEYCSVANKSQAYVGAWGWSDVTCGGQYVVMCMVQSE